MERAKTADHVIWDCGSSLYDSFELNSLRKELDSALASRTLSMPHLSHRRAPPPPPPLNKKQPLKIFRSIQRVIRAVFRPKTTSITAKNSNFDEQSRNKGFYVVYDRPPKFSSIPEVPEFDELSPELRSLVRKSASARFERDGDECCSCGSLIGSSCCDSAPPGLRSRLGFWQQQLHHLMWKNKTYFSLSFHRIR